MATAIQFEGYKYLDINNYGLLPRIVYRINEGEWQIPEWDDENSRYIFHVTKGDIIQFKPDFSLQAHTPSESIRYIKSIYINPYNYNSNSNYSVEYNNIYNLTEKDIILILSTFNNGSYNSYIDYIYEQENFDNSIFELDENEQIIWNSYFIENYGDIYYPLVKQNILDKYNLIVGTTLYSWRFDSSRNIYTFNRFPNEGDMALIIDSGSTVSDIYYNYINSIEYKTNIYLNKKLFNFTTDTNCRFSASGNPLSLFYEYEYDFKKLAQINTKAMFMRLFAHCEGIVSCKNISLSPQLLSELCYYEMFIGCSNLKDSIKLKNIRKLGWACYAEMYAGCTSLEEAGGLMAQKITSSCYANMFYGCSSLKEVPLICAETLKEESFKGTFSRCSSLKTIPNNFFHKTVPYRGYYRTFANCSGIENLEDLNFDEIGEQSLYETFKDCTSIESIGNISINKTQSYGCMQSMFEGCTSLESIGNIQIKKNNDSQSILSSIFKDCSSLINTGYIKLDILSSSCLSEAFENCISLVNYVNIIYNGDITSSCFQKMYLGCINLETAPELLCEKEAFSAYSEMFNGCNKLNYLKVNLKNYNNRKSDTTKNWLLNVSEHGDLISNSSCKWLIDNPSGVPEGWNLYYSDSIYLYKKYIRVNNNSQQVIVKVNSLEDWRITTSIPSWLHFSKINEVAGATQISISIDANQDEDVFREINVTFKSENFENTLYISQNYINEYVDKPLTFNILNDGDLVIHRYQLIYNMSGQGKFSVVFKYKINDGNWSNQIEVSRNGRYSIPVVTGDKVEIIFVGSWAGTGWFEFNMYEYEQYLEQRGSYGAVWIIYTTFDESTCEFSLSGNLLTLDHTEDRNGNVSNINDYEDYSEYLDEMVTSKNYLDNAYRNLFSNCVTLMSIDNLYIEPSINMESDGNIFYGMFSNCINLTSIPNNFLRFNTLVSGCYQSMFSGCIGITSLGNNLLPATTLADYCYRNMFYGCIGLTTLPSGLLQATTLTESCYSSMFYGCTGLTSLPNNLLPAMNLSNFCYSSMFYGCTGLTSIPNNFLPATTLSSSCYYGMFSGCTHLTTIPYNLLTATNISSSCYEEMFLDCSNLIIPNSFTLPATELSISCYKSMFKNCISIESIPENLLPAGKNSIGYLTSECYFSMFYGCTRLNSVPDNLLPALELTSSCYYNMFYGCSNLIKAPKLPAPILSSSCYSQMFSECTRLNYIDCQATDLSASSCLYRWVNNVSATGKFKKSPYNNSWTIGVSGIPDGWTIMSIEVSDTYFEVEANSSTVNILVTNTFDTNWTLINNESWINSNVNSGGPGNVNLILTISATNSERTGHIYISSPELTSNIEITILQHEPRVSIETLSYLLGPSSTTIYISGENTYSNNWYLINDNSWINPSDTIITPGYFNIPVNIDTTTVERTGEIWIGNQSTYNSSTNKFSIEIIQKTAYYEVNLNDQWIIDTSRTGPNGETIYESNSNHNKHGNTSIMYITINGYNTFNLYVSVSSESGYDILSISNLDTSSNKWTGSGNKLFTDSSINPQVYTNITSGTHTITIKYSKDGSGNTGDDRGYIYIPQQ